MNKNMLYQKSEKAEKATECSSSKQLLQLYWKLMKRKCEEV